MGQGTGVQNLVLRLLREDSGQATTEYILILSAAVTAAVALSRALLTGLNKGILVMGAQLERDLKTGRAPPNVWRN